jgi:cell division transport system ATP-binding protein
MIELIDVSKSYANGTKALSHIDLTVEDGEFVFVMGRNGSGKSTLLKLILKEIEPTSGSIVVSDADLSEMPRSYIPKYRRTLGVVFQDFRLLPDLTVYENVAFAQHVIGKSTWEIKESVPQALRMVGLSSKYKSYPRMLSGGEQQRVAIARAIVNDPEILLCDEPTGNLDRKTAEEIMNLLYYINESGTTVIVITHSQEIARSSGMRIVTMDRGIITSDTGAQ